MIAQNTEIIKTAVTGRDVTILVQPEGTFWGDDRVTIQVIPQKDGVLLHFSGICGKRVCVEPSAANEAQVRIVKEA